MDKRIRMIEESDGKGEEKRKSGSCKSIEKMWKRRREESKDGLEEKEEKSV